MENHLNEELCGRSYRQKKKPIDTICPICGCTIRQNEMDQHFALEVDRLDKLTTSNIHHRNRKTVPSSPSEPGSSKTNSTSLTNDECWGKFQKIKNNRQTRLKVQYFINHHRYKQLIYNFFEFFQSKSRKRRAEDTICPICNQIITEDIQHHVELCLRSTGADRPRGEDDGEDDDESIDVEGDEIYEEYEWAGQTRIRASSLLAGGYAATGLGTNISSTSSNLTNLNHNTSDTASDDELNVDGDDTQIFGQPQYTVRDIIMPLTVDDDQKTSSYLRDLVNGNDSSTTFNQQQTNNNTNSNSNVSLTQEQEESDMNSFSGTTTTATIISTNNYDMSSQQHIIESLKSKIVEYEKYLKNKPKCLICMDDFKTPVCSICCWHVHCEECWLKTLGSRKVCPQCNMITSPNDLRRIFM